VAKEENVSAMFEWIENNAELGKVDVCVANAGFNFDDSLMDGTPAKWRQMLDVNVIGLAHCTQLALKSMFHHKIDDGQIIFLNSMSGHRMVWSAGTRFYTATKFACTALLEGFRQEVRDHDKGRTNIRVSAVSPGMVESEFHKVMKGEEEGKKMYANLPCMQAEDMADAVKYIMSAPVHVQIGDILMRPTKQRM